MKKRIAYSAIIVFFSLFLLKVGTDLCLPYRGSAIFPLLENRETFYCQVFADWDEYGRWKRTQVFEVLAVPMSKLDKDAINPSVVGWGDLLLFWRTPVILPLILEQVPEYPVSCLKLFIFAVASIVFVTLILHYVALIYRAITDTTSPMQRVHQKSAQEERVSSLMGRSSASNSIVNVKKRQ